MRHRWEIVTCVAALALAALACDRADRRAGETETRGATIPGEDRDTARARDGGEVGDRLGALPPPPRGQEADRTGRPPPPPPVAEADRTGEPPPAEPGKPVADAAAPVPPALARQFDAGRLSVVGSAGERDRNLGLQHVDGGVIDLNPVEIPPGPGPQAGALAPGNVAEPFVPVDRIPTGVDTTAPGGARAGTMANGVLRGPHVPPPQR